jgi:hypothetical protein
MRWVRVRLRVFLSPLALSPSRHHRPREDGLTHPADPPRSNLAQVLALLSPASQTLASTRASTDAAPPAGGTRAGHTAMKKLRIVILGFGTARQKMVLD